MRIFIPFMLLVLAGTCTSAHAQPKPEILTVEAWRADLDQLVAAVHEFHPQPFKHATEPDWQAAAENLRADIPRLSDHGIMVRLAGLVANLQDGHTRLSIPRAADDQVFSVAHSADPAPSDERLIFSRLPVAFQQLPEGLIIHGAAPEHGRLLGSRVEAVAGRPASDVLKAAHALAYGENEGFRDLVASDMLALPDVLKALGIEPDENGAVRFTLVHEDGTREETSLAPRTEAGPDWSWLSSTALHSRNPDAPYWRTYLRRENIVYVQIDRISNDGEEHLAPFIDGAVTEAERRNARLVIDLRWNTGGRGGFNRAIVLAVLQSREINQMNRLFVIIGPRTFSAAQMLLNELERYTRATFIGAPSGAMPDHFGDPRKLQLKNSGLTLRVSTLHWSSWISNDGRTATAPAVSAPLSLAAMREGIDPAVEAVRTYDGPDTWLDFFAAGLEREDHYMAYRYLFCHLTAPDTGQEDLSDDLLRLGKRYEAQGRNELASFAYQYGLAFYPDDEDLKRALEALPSQ